MKKWADYLISEVRYDSKNLISTAIRHQDTDLGITLGEPIDRLTITSDIKNGLSYITIYNGINSWKKGHKIQTFSIAGIPYLRIDENKVKLDYLGDLPELLLVKSNSILEPELPSGSRGSLPKESTEELPQELDLVPEPENEQATPEQIEKLNQLQKQIEELENVSEQATPEQIIQLDDLQCQIDKLENMLSNPISFESKSTEEFIPEQFSKVKELEKEIKKFEGVETEYEIIQTLQKQNKKLDDIEKKLHDLEKMK